MIRLQKLTALTLSSCLALPSVAAATESRHATLQIHADDAGEASEILQRRIEERGAVILRDAGVMPGRGPDDAVIAVTVVASTDQPGYTYDVVVTDDGSMLQQRSAKCELCTETELIERISTTLGETASAIEADPPAAVGSTEPAEPPTESVAPAQPDSRPHSNRSIDADRPAMTVMGKAGIGVLSVGVVSSAVGIGLLARSPQPLPDDARYVRDTRPAGGTLLGLGLAAAAAGGILLGVDLRRQRNQTAWSPFFSGHAAGLMLTGRI